jgi:hypothetical protein
MCQYTGQQVVANATVPPTFAPTPAPTPASTTFTLASPVLAPANVTQGVMNAQWADSRRATVAAIDTSLATL